MLELPVDLLVKGFQCCYFDFQLLSSLESFQASTTASSKSCSKESKSGIYSLCNTLKPCAYNYKIKHVENTSSHLRRYSTSNIYALQHLKFKMKHLIPIIAFSASLRVSSQRNYKHKHALQTYKSHESILLNSNEI